MTICNLKIHTLEYITSMIRVSMLKLAAFGLLGFLVVLILPANAYEETPGLLYGAVTLVAHDASGNEFFSQTIHNQLYDQGEDFMIDQSFTNLGTDVPNDTQIGSICLSAAAFLVDETDLFSDFNTAHDAADTSPTDSSQNCVTDPVVTKATQVVTLGNPALTFTADVAEGANWFAGDTVTHIGICDAHVTNLDVRGCAATLFAVVNTSDVTLADTETVDVTYTFDISDDLS